MTGGREATTHFMLECLFPKDGDTPVSKTTHIIFTGGGSAGHVTPNIALIQRCLAAGWRVSYIGSAQGIERELIMPLGIPYYSVTAGKLRRYFSWRTFLSPFQILWGILQATILCWRLRPDVIFSKGGFVAFPVVVGAWLNRIPVMAHESDFSPGLANRLSFPFARKICVTFSEGKKFFKQSEKVITTGTPLRAELLHGDPEKGRALCGFDDKSVILIIGGGLGAAPINHAVREALPSLLKAYNVIHLCGQGKTESRYDNTPGYQQFDYVQDALPDLFACAELVISRAGANSLYELLALRKPHILIPLSKQASRGDQIHNADYFSKQGVSLVIAEEGLTPTLLVDTIKQLQEQKQTIQEKLNQLALPDAVGAIYQELTTLAVA